MRLFKDFPAVAHVVCLVQSPNNKEVSLSKTTKTYWVSQK